MFLGGWQEKFTPKHFLPQTQFLLKIKKAR
jgi:hypothetical protein